MCDTEYWATQEVHVQLSGYEPNESVYIYESCTGTLYVSDEPGRDWEICEQCGDSDRLLASGWAGELIATFERLVAGDNAQPLRGEE